LLPQNLKMRKWCTKPSGNLRFKGSYPVCRSAVVTPFVDLVTGFDLNFNPGYLTMDPYAVSEPDRRAPLELMQQHDVI
jgi:hypothetical protein